LMGHSFGGYETNYIITHSHLFGAAVSFSGVSDFVNGYNGISGARADNGKSLQFIYEIGQNRLGSTLWQRPDVYIENSPIFNADKISTPVLLMANYGDENVPCEQGFEFFMALRRLHKKAWLLQYDNASHMVFDPTDQRDLTLRMQQFFDYYLKGKIPPKWMTEGIPASEKQVDNGLEADTSGKQP